MKTLACLLLSIASAACVDNSSAEDGVDDTFLDDGKADTGNVSDGTPEAAAVLRVANEKSRTQLKEHGVPALAAQNIEAVRMGDDESSNADDVAFTSLAQLDAVPYVGPNAFARLLAYATELGYVTPAPMPAHAPADLWNVAACPQITYAQLLAKFPSGGTVYDFQRPVTTTSRHRNNCNPVTGCTPWQDGGALLYVSRDEKIEMPSSTQGTAEMSNAYDLTQIRLYFSAGHFQVKCGSIVESDDVQVVCGLNAGFEPGDDLDLDARICADGSYHFTSTVLDNQSDDTANLNQIAVYGQLF